jgi:2-polyprenyl-3-methyl-5-hydroxy-6-metoxy-1,4-benzoquinol methylase
MWLSQNLKNSHIYSFDHSINSLNTFAASAFNLGLNNLHISMQDATSLHYKPDYFDVIVGNAVLHHFLDWNNTFFKLLSLLKPGGLLIFSEPFAYGYLIIVNIINSAHNILKIST